MIIELDEHLTNEFEKVKKHYRQREGDIDIFIELGFLAIKIINDLLLVHSLLNKLTNLILPFEAAGHIAILENQRALARAGQILCYLGDGQGRAAEWRHRPTCDQ